MWASSEGNRINPPAPLPWWERLWGSCYCLPLDLSCEDADTIEAETTRDDPMQHLPPIQPQALLAVKYLRHDAAPVAKVLSKPIGDPYTGANLETLADASRHLATGDRAAADAKAGDSHLGIISQKRSIAAVGTGKVLADVGSAQQLPEALLFSGIAAGNNQGGSSPTAVGSGVTIAGTEPPAFRERLPIVVLKEGGTVASITSPAARAGHATIAGWGSRTASGSSIVAMQGGGSVASSEPPIAGNRPSLSREIGMDDCGVAATTELSGTLDISPLFFSEDGTDFAFIGSSEPSETFSSVPQERKYMTAVEDGASAVGATTSAADCKVRAAREATMGWPEDRDTRAIWQEAPTPRGPAAKLPAPRAPPSLRVPEVAVLSGGQEDSAAMKAQASRGVCAAREALSTSGAPISRESQASVEASAAPSPEACIAQQAHPAPEVSAAEGSAAEEAPAAKVASVDQEVCTNSEAAIAQEIPPSLDAPITLSAPAVAEAPVTFSAAAKVASVDQEACANPEAAIAREIPPGLDARITLSAPAVAEAPVIFSAPVVSEAPIAGEAPTALRAAHERGATWELPVAQEALAPQEAPAPLEKPSAMETPEAQLLPTALGTPAAQDAFEIEGAPAAATPGALEASVAKEALATQEAVGTQDASDALDTFAAHAALASQLETPVAEEALAVETAPAATELLAVREALAAQSPHASTEAPTSLEALVITDAPAVEEALADQQPLASSEAPTSLDAPAVIELPAVQEPLAVQQPLAFNEAPSSPDAPAAMEVSAVPESIAAQQPLASNEAPSSLDAPAAMEVSAVQETLAAQQSHASNEAPTSLEAPVALDAPAVQEALAGQPPLASNEAPTSLEAPVALDAPAVQEAFPAQQPLASNEASTSLEAPVALEASAVQETLGIQDVFTVAQASYPARFIHTPSVGSWLRITPPRPLAAAQWRTDNQGHAGQLRFDSAPLEPKLPQEAALEASPLPAGKLSPGASNSIKARMQAYGEACRTPMLERGVTAPPTPESWASDTVRSRKKVFEVWPSVANAGSTPQFGGSVARMKGRLSFGQSTEELSPPPDRPRLCLANVSEQRVLKVGILRMNEDLTVKREVQVTELPTHSVPKMLGASFLTRLLSEQVELKSTMEGDVCAAQSDLKHLSAEQLLRIRSRTLDLLTESSSHSARNSFLQMVDKYLFSKLALWCLRRRGDNALLPERPEVLHAIGLRVTLVLGACDLIAQGWGQQATKGSSGALPPVPACWVLGLAEGDWPEDCRVALFHSEDLWLEVLPGERPDFVGPAAGQPLALFREASQGAGAARMLHWEITVLDPSTDDVMAELADAERMPARNQSQRDLSSELSAAVARRNSSTLLLSR